MTVLYDHHHHHHHHHHSRSISLSSSFSRPSPPLTLDDKFDSLKEIGDGSFGSVVLARTRTAASHIAKRGTLVAIKTMKKSFESFDACLDLREVVFLRSLPPHPHLVPALDIFLDPMTRKLHIAMEYMDGNLYQLMKARHHHLLDPAAVKSILFQIMAGLEHIHAHGFFHRDIKPENILISTPKGSSSSSSSPSNGAPHPYTVKIADFGLARQIASRHPYTTYVSTRWYRAPEVLLRAGTYSAPVDLWAVGAMAVEIATLKPLFPGRNEVDQVWRVCEIMGSPGTWFAGPNGSGAVEGRQTSSSSSERSYASSAASSYSHPQSSSSHSNPNTTKAQQIGGGEWKDGVRLANKLGFSFPKIAPHSIHSILPSPACGPPSLARFVGWCLMWDPKNRPTARQALTECEYFREYASDGSIPVAGTAVAGSGSGTNPPVNQTPVPPANATAGVAAAGRRLLPRRRASEKVVAGAGQNSAAQSPQQQQQQQPTLTQQQAQAATAQFPNQNTAQVQGQAQSPRPSWFRRSLIAGVNLGTNSNSGADSPRTTRRVSSHFSRHAGNNANNADAASTISPSPSTASLTPTITSTSTGNNAAATGVKKTTLASRNSYSTVNTHSHSRHPSVTSTYSTNTNGTTNAGNAGNGPAILPKISKRATWANGEPAPTTTTTTTTATTTINSENSTTPTPAASATTTTTGILPSITRRPVSPLVCRGVVAHGTTPAAAPAAPTPTPAAHARSVSLNSPAPVAQPPQPAPVPLPVPAGHTASTARKFGRTLSLNYSNHAGHANTGAGQEQQQQLGQAQAAAALNANAGQGPLSPSPKESFFSHLRKRARRLSGRAAFGKEGGGGNAGEEEGAAAGSNGAGVGTATTRLSGLWASARGGMRNVAGSTHSNNNANGNGNGNGNALPSRDLCKSPSDIDVDMPLASPVAGPANVPLGYAHAQHHLSALPSPSLSLSPTSPSPAPQSSMPISSRTRHALHMSVSRYEPPAEQDELLHDQLVAQQQQEAAQKENARTAAIRQDLPFSTPGPGRAIGTGVGQMQMPRRAPSWHYTTANAHGHGMGVGNVRPAIVEEPLREDGVVNYASPAVGAGMGSGSNVGGNGNGGVAKRWSSGALPSLAQGLPSPYPTPASSAARRQEE